MNTILTALVFTCLVALATSSPYAADILSHESCRYIVENRYCVHDFLVELCDTTCNCKNVLSDFSCGVLKKDGECSKADIKAKCRLTCDACTPTPP